MINLKKKKYLLFKNCHSTRLQFQDRSYLPIALSIALSCISMISLVKGAYKITWGSFKDIICQHSPPNIPHQILIYIRLPRILLAIVTGATFGAVGTALQSLFRNPLADPSLIGVTSGAASGAALTIVLLNPTLHTIAPAFAQIISIQLFSFLFALLTVSVIYQFSNKNDKPIVQTMLLAGIAINALSGALISALNYIATDHSLRLLSLWHLGGFSDASWHTLLWVTPPCGLAIFGLYKISLALNILQLGEEQAFHLGIHTKNLTNQVFFFTAISIGALTSHIGLINFLGIIAPHCVRLICGPNCRRVMPNAILFGSILTVTGDFFSRILLSPIEIPFSILIALIGAPFFLYLLKSK